MAVSFFNLAGSEAWNILEYIDVAKKNMLFLNACTLLFDNSMSE
jgi:hypothetical protein